jgi:hypothetical protein
MPLALLRPLAALLMLAGPALARELADAPEMRVVGFSEDGRHFAYEQYLNDTLSGSVLASIDVIDRETGRSAVGFPLGYLGMSKDGRYPLKVGDHAIEVDESEPEEKQLEALRSRLRDAATPKLRALGIGDRHRRLAGQPLTDRTTRPGPISFVLGGTVPGAVPDQQPAYRLTTTITPADLAACISGKAKPRDHAIEVEIAEIDARTRKAGTRKTASVAWAHGDSECARTALVTDILAPESGDAKAVVVIALAVSWAPHAEGARYLAAFVPLP